MPGLTNLGRHDRHDAEARTYDGRALRLFERFPLRAVESLDPANPGNANFPLLGGPAYELEQIAHPGDHYPENVEAQ